MKIETFEFILDNIEDFDMKVDDLRESFNDHTSIYKDTSVVIEKYPDELRVVVKILKMKDEVN